MSIPFAIQRSDVPFPHRIWKACALAWKNATIMWGGQNSGPPGSQRLSQVYCFISGEWILKETSGDIPQKCSMPCNGSACNESSIGQRRASPQVINDQMFVLGSPCGDGAALYSLDLRSWVWTRLSPSGTPPKRNIWLASSFVHIGKLYFFGGTIGIDLPGEGRLNYRSTSVRSYHQFIFGYYFFRDAMEW